MSSSRVAFTPVSQNCFHELDAERAKGTQQQKQGGKIGAKNEAKAKAKGKAKGKAKDAKPGSKRDRRRR